MAVWQFEIHLLPTDGLSLLLKDEVGRTDESSCAEPQLVASMMAWLDTWLPRLPSWSDEIVTWGEESGHRIRMVLQKNKCVELSARIDVRQSVRVFVDGLVYLANECSAQWVTTDGNRLDTTRHAFTTAISESPAARFLKNPNGFLEELDKQRQDNLDE